MESSTSLTLFVAKPVGIPYGAAMSRLRTWLDQQKMQPIHLKLAPRGRVGFEIGFRNDADATRFESVFDWPQRPHGLGCGTLIAVPIGFTLTRGECHGTHTTSH